jgi:hypothetical protein
LKALFDHGSYAVLINDAFANELGLRHHRLPSPNTVQLAMENGDEKNEIRMTEWVKLKLRDPSNFWTAKTVRAIVAPGLCSPVILSLPFLTHNHIVIDHEACTAIDKSTGFDLLHPTAPPAPSSENETKGIFPTTPG